MEITFQIKAHGEEKILEQLTRTLRKRIDVCSRSKYPRLWSLTDQLNGGAAPKPRKNLRAAVFLFLGFVLVVPGLLELKTLWYLLLAGVLSLGCGFYLQKRDYNPMDDPFRRAAKKLQEQTGSLQDDQFVIAFLDDGMTITNRVTGTMIPIPYESFECVVEARDLYLLIYKDQVTVVVKQDLSSGSIKELDALLKKRVSLLQAE